MNPLQTNPFRKQICSWLRTSILPSRLFLNVHIATCPVPWVPSSTIPWLCRQSTTTTHDTPRIRRQWRVSTCRHQRRGKVQSRSREEPNLCWSQQRYFQSPCLYYQWHIDDNYTKPHKKAYVFAGKTYRSLRNVFSSAVAELVSPASLATQAALASCQLARKVLSAYSRPSSWSLGRHDRTRNGIRQIF